MDAKTDIIILYFLHHFIRTFWKSEEVMKETADCSKCNGRRTGTGENQI
jgi:hypothetical protein